MNFNSVSAAFRFHAPGDVLVVGGLTAGWLMLAAMPPAAAPVLGGGESAVTQRASWPHLASGPLEDNSFLIEEAYNQEAGVIQHIFAVLRDQRTGDWLGSFTEEWPLPDERHQLSVTLPFSLAEEQDAASGVGDVLLNYRRQLLAEDVDRPAFAPRLSLILPTGDHRRGLGWGAVGLQTNLPASKQVSGVLAGHVNLGMTVIPDARAPAESPHAETLVSGTGGASLIWEPWDAVNLLGELVGSHDAEIVSDGVTYRDRVTFNPGLRIGWNGPGGVQWVGGAAAPIGLTRETDDIGVFLYLSVEHAVTTAARAERW